MALVPLECPGYVYFRDLFAPATHFLIVRMIDSGASGGQGLSLQAVGEGALTFLGVVDVMREAR
jgi:hypothetical protein